MPTYQELIAQRNELDAQIKQAEVEARSAAIAQANAILAPFGIHVTDPNAKGKGDKVPAKYRNKATGQTWSGRGLKPRWFDSAHALGQVELLG